jgi:bifunctional non-homologous end joining protein LigD
MGSQRAQQLLDRVSKRKRASLARPKPRALGVSHPRRTGYPSSEKRAAFPAQVGLQLARLVAQAPAGNHWLHEIKYDGYRVLVWRNGSAIRVTSRGDQNWSAKLPGVVAATAALPCRSCILDGELVALEAHGRSSFGQLQRSFADAAGEAHLRIMVFDLLYQDGQDLRQLSQLERKAHLTKLLQRCRPPLQLTRYARGNGVAAARAACDAGLEGIVCKTVDAPYREGRTGAWVKVKCVLSDEYAVVGYTLGQGARARLGSLLLGSPQPGGTWHYWGRVGTGLDERTIAVLLQQLKKAAHAVAFENPPTRTQLRGADPVWTQPQLVVEVEFRGQTEDGLLRQASLKGVRLDRSIASLRSQQRNAARVESHLGDSPDH